MSNNDLNLILLSLGHHIHIICIYIAIMNYLILNDTINISNPLIKRYIYTVSNYLRGERGNERGGSISNSNLTIQQLFPSLPPSTKPLHFALSHCLHHSVTYSSTPFPNSNANLLPHPHSKIHPTTPWPPQFCTHHPTAPANLSQIPHNPPGNEPHPPLLRYLTLPTSHLYPFTSLLILQQHN